MQEKVEEYHLGSTLHLNAVHIWICGLRLWQKVDLKGLDLISISFILLYDMSTRGCVTFMEAEYLVVER